MKKLFIIVCLEILVLSCSSIHKYNSNDTMEQTDKVETDDNLLLNEIESTYLNRIFEATRKDFDFTNKKVAFLTGSLGKTMSSKEHYFDMHEKHSTNANYPCDNGTLYTFNAVQKSESDGYDDVIVYWNKFVTPIETVVERLKKKR